jgi:REP element-mobilizing transposase RayT
MARKPRLDIPGGFYHVLARGNRRTTIFYDHEDYRAYLQRLERDRQRDSMTRHALTQYSGMTP